MRQLLARFTFWLVSAGMAALIAVIFLQVFFRYVLNEPLTWPEELGRYLFVWIVFLGIPDAYRDGKHLGMDLLTARLPRALRSVLALLAEIVIALFAVVAVYSSIDLLRLTLDQTAPVLQIPMAVVYFAFTLGFFLIVLYTLLGWRRTGEVSPGQHLYGLRADGEVNVPASGTS